MADINNITTSELANQIAGLGEMLTGMGRTVATVGPAQWTSAGEDLRWVAAQLASLSDDLREAVLR